MALKIKQLFEYDDPYGKKLSRTKLISLNDAINWYHRHWRNSTLSKSADNFNLYRRIEGFSGEFGFVQPSKYNRISRNTVNYYTLMMDELPEWQRFPKRSKSIICSCTSAEPYKSDYIVIPTPNSKFGICKKHDLWYSFSSIMSASTFNYLLNAEYESQFMKKLKANSAEELLSKLSTLDSSNLNTQLSVYSDTGKTSVDEIAREFFSPDGFGLKTWPFKLNRRSEVWSDSDCIVIKQEKFDEFLDKINE